MIGRTGQQTRSMTTGSPLRLLTAFALPLMLGNMFQQCYLITDTLIVSRRLGVDALAALGTTDWYLYLVLSVIQALTQGFAILLAQQFGAQDRNGLRKSFAQSALLSLVSAVVITTGAMLTAPLVLHLLNVPQSIRPAAFVYIMICFAGIPAQILYNFTASVLRAFGNSRTPFAAMVGSSVLNILLDILFVLVLPWGIAGAAAATVLSQILAAVWCLLPVCRLEILSGPDRLSWRPAWEIDRYLLRLAAPVVLQNVLISVGGMIVTSVINLFGVDFMAGCAAAGILYGAIETAAIAYGFACTTFAGQNYGAGRMDRVRKGFRQGMLLAVLTGGIIAFFTILFGRQITAAFLTGDAARVAAAGDIAYRYLFIICIYLPILYILYVARSTLQGLGDTVMPMISGLAEFVVRIFMAVVISKYLGADAIFYGEVAAWAAADIVLLSSVIRHLRKEIRPAEEPAETPAD